MKEEEDQTKVSSVQPEGEIRASDEEPENRYCLDIEALKSEFDAFLYAVSHDLGAPLRAIHGFSLLLLDQYSDRLDEKGRDYLTRIQTASRKIDRMVDDLLQISRLAKAPMSFQEVDLSRIARRIADRLGKSAPGRDVQFIMAENIRAVGDEALLTLALDNLLTNAWKFTKVREKAVITFGALQEGKERVMFVGDNGIGFSMAHAARRLFKPFQKLENAVDQPGSGIGLAKVNRIIQRSGGKIWAESEEEKGTTIFFTLGNPR